MKQTRTYEASSYGFANELWVQKLFGPNSKLAQVSIIFFSLAPLLIGIGVSLAFGFLGKFLNNWAIYYGAFGIYLTTITIWKGSIWQYEIYDRFLACFDMTPKERQALLHRTLAAYSDTVMQIRSSLTVFIVAAAIAIIGFWSREIGNALSTGIPDLFRFEDFNRAGWYDPTYRSVAVALTLLFAFWASIPLATAYQVMLKMPRFLFRCSQKGSALFPRLIKLHFLPLTSFYTRVSLLWSVGIGLFLLLFRHNNNWFFLGATSFLFLLGLINFFVPQFVYAKTVVRAEAYWLERVGLELGQFASGTVETEAVSTEASRKKLLEIDSYFLTHDAWVYPIHETYVVAAAQLVSFGGLQTWASLRLFGNVAGN